MNRRRARLDHVKESHVLKAVRDYLDAEGIRYVRVHAGVVQRNGYWLHLAPAGTPDLVLEIPSRRPVRSSTAVVGDPTFAESFARIAWVETKRPTGHNQLSNAQVAFQQETYRRRGYYYVVRSPEDIRFYIPPKRELLFEEWVPTEPARLPTPKAAASGESPRARRVARSSAAAPDVPA